MPDEGFENIRDITAVDPEEWLNDGPNHVYFYLSNGETIYVTLGMEGEADENEDTVPQPLRCR